MIRHTETARAKVNLTLLVLGRRRDGFHELASLVAFADVGDELTLEPAQRDDVTVTGPFAPTIAGENLVAVAMARVRNIAPCISGGHIALEKRLPVAAGIGGGSADAAAVLRLLRRTNPDAPVDWPAIAAELGSDVPICFANRPAFMTGTGDRLVPYTELPKLDAVLINPRVAVPADKTAQVFRRLAAPALEDGRVDDVPPGPFSSTDELLGFMADQRNDLETAARSLVPIVADVLAALANSRDCLLARMSGGGPTCFGIYPSPARAEAAAAAVRQAHPSWWVAATRLG